MHRSERRRSGCIRALARPAPGFATIVLSSAGIDAIDCDIRGKHMQVESSSQSSNAQRWLFAATVLGIRLPGQVVLVAMLFFYTDVKQLPPAWASTAMAIYAIYNALNNPILGYIQDKFPIRGQRRIPWIRYGIVPFLLCFMAIWAPPFNGATQPLALVIYFFVILVLYDTFNTIVFNSYYALLPEMFPRALERTDVSARMNVVLTFALLFGIALPVPISQIIGWAGMGMLFGLISIAAVFIGLRSLSESGTAPPIPLSFRSALRATLFNRSFLTVSLAQMLRFVATQTQAAGTIFFIKYALGLNQTNATLVLTTVFVVSGLMAYPWQRFIADRFGTRTTALIAYLVTCTSACMLWFVETLPATLAAAVAIGCGFAGLFLVDNIFIADVIDEEESRTGLRREGMYFGLSSMAGPLGSVFVSIAFGVITTTFGYDPLLTAQPDSAGVGFRLFISIVPAIACVGAFATLLLYPLHGDRLRAMRVQLQKRRATLKP